jgi:hypothetical protein
VAHELVANAVDHACTTLELPVSFDGVEIIVEVHDQSLLEPRLQPLNPAAARGRGLQMVDALTNPAAASQCFANIPLRRPGGETAR